jgi:nitrate/nitrite transporter NarK
MVMHPRRGLGGYISNNAKGYIGMCGRLWAQTICLLLEGALVLVFTNTNSLGGAIAVMVFFSLFVQMAEGTDFTRTPCALASSFSSLLVPLQPASPTDTTVTVKHTSAHQLQQYSKQYKLDTVAHNN